MAFRLWVGTENNPGSCDLLQTHNAPARQPSLWGGGLVSGSVPGVFIRQDPTV